MAASVNTSGSQTTTIAVEHTLATITAAGTYQLVVDLAAMLGGTTPDVVRIYVYGKARSADTERIEEVYSFVGLQAKPLWRSPPVWSPHHIRFSLNQEQGTSRAFPWAVYQP
jgi:hypothetical protein